MSFVVILPWIFDIFFPINLPPLFVTLWVFSSKENKTASAIKKTLMGKGFECANKHNLYVALHSSSSHSDYTGGFGFSPNRLLRLLDSSLEKGITTGQDLEVENFLTLPRKN